MEASARRKLLCTLLDYQFDMLWCGMWGEGNAEFLFAHTVALLKSDQALRDWFFELVQDTASVRAPVIHGKTLKRPPSYVPDSFILYAAHATRWPEFYEIAARIAGTPDDTWPGNPNKRWSKELQAALSDTWEDRDFYVGLKPAA